MGAENTDLLLKVAPNTGWQLSASGIADAEVETIGLVSASGLPEDTAVLVTIDRVDQNGAKTPSKMERVIGVVSGDNLVNCVRGVEGTAQGHTGGAVVEIVISKSNMNKMIEHLLSGHNQDGSHKENILNINVGHNANGTHKIAAFATLPAPEGFLINGKIVPSVASGNLTVAIKTLAGEDPSASDPVYVRIGGVVRSITSALSMTIPAGTNCWFNAGSAEFATKEIDYFAYLVLFPDASIDIAISRVSTYAGYPSTWPGSIPGNTSERCIKGGKIGTIDNTFSEATVIGRFSATLSAGAGYTWSVPTFTAENLVQRPIYETRWLDFIATIKGSTGTVGAYTELTSLSKYRVVNSTLYLAVQKAITNKGSWTGDFIMHLPFSANNVYVTPFGEIIATGTNTKKAVGHYLSADATLRFTDIIRVGWYPYSDTVDGDTIAIRSFCEI